MGSTKLRKRNPENNLQTQEVPENQCSKNYSVYTEKISWRYQFNKKLLTALVVFRICNACIIQTYFVPDEYWQGPEVAHRLVFGYGYLTWEWREGIRGYTFPLIFTTLYKVLAFLKLDNARVVILGPRIMQGILAGIGDFYLYKLAKKLFDHEVGVFALLCNVLSWFNFYCVTRVLTNSTETVLTVMGMFYWPWNTVSKQAALQSNMRTALLLAGAACLIRPTAAVVWLPLAILHLFTTDKKLAFLLKDALPISLLVVGFSVIIDSWFYGKLILVQLKFLQFNVWNNMGAFYGSHPWYWYFTEGFPSIMFTHLIIFIPGILKSPPNYRIIGWLMVWVISVYSFLAHKEFRFIFPILPLAMLYCGFYLNALCKASSPKIQKKEKVQGILMDRPCKKATILLGMLFVTNVPVALYTTLVHQRGTTDVMYYIQEQCKLSQRKPSILFFMPCHSTPFYSYVHHNISMQFLSCEPSTQSDYIDEADLFYLNPQKWTKSFFQKWQGKELKNLPSHIFFFNVLLQEIENVLKQFDYKECARFFHTNFPEGRVGSEVLVYCADT